METEREQRDRELFNVHAQAYSLKDLYRPSALARERRLRATLAVLPLDTNVRVLEVGCGAGFSARYLEGLYSEFVGIDYAENLIACAQEYNGTDRAHFLAVHAKEYRPDQAFDVVLMVGVLHHFDEIEKTLRDILTLVKPGGWILANEPQGGNVLIQGARKVRSWVDSAYSPEQTQFTPEALGGLFHGVGLHDIRIVPQGLFSTPFAEVMLKPETFFLPLSKGCIAMDRWAERVLGRYLSSISWNVIAAGRRPQEGRS